MLDLTRYRTRTYHGTGLCKWAVFPKYFHVVKGWDAIADGMTEEEADKLALEYEERDERRQNEKTNAIQQE